MLRQEADAMKTETTETRTANAQRKAQLSPELQELVHMLDALEAGLHEKFLAAR
jgi:hypothetical protein